MDEKDLLTVGELARKMETTVRTLQYYDKEGLLKPSARSEGGRRLYTKKDMVKLHQIFSMKFLGFSLEEIKNNSISLDTPQEVVEVLSKQEKIVRMQIDNLTAALLAIQALKDEVKQMNKVDFNKYADIITLLRLKNEGYWIVKFFDEKLMTHIKDKFMGNPDFGLGIFNKWKIICNETVQYKEQGGTPESERGQELAKQWWDIVMDFTGGDMNMIPDLIKFNESKQGWSKELQEKQSIVDEFMEKALEIYLQNQNIEILETEVE